MKSVLTKEGLSQLWDSMSNKFVKKENGKGLSSNDYTDADKKKVDELESTYVKIGDFQDTKTTFERTLPGSVNGGLSLLSVKGDYKQDGIPAPDAKVEIENSIINTLKSTMKNLLPNKGTKSTTQGITFTVNEDKSITVNGTATGSAYFTVGQITLVPNQTYNFSIGVDWNTNTQCYMTGVDGKSDWLGPRIFTPTTNNKITCQIYISSGTTVNNLTFKPMIRLASITNGTYEPYKGVEITLSAPVTLRAIGDVRDTIVKQDGVYGVLRYVGSLILNGTETWTSTTLNRIYTTLIATKIVKPIDNKTAGNARCSHFAIRGKDKLDTGCFGIETTGALFFLDNTNATSVDTWKTWLATNNIAVQYELATPVFEPLPLEDQIKLHALETFDDVTYLSTDSVIDPIIEAEYGVSVAGGYSLKALNIAEANKVRYEQLNTLTNELATQLVGNEV